VLELKIELRHKDEAELCQQQEASYCQTAPKAYRMVYLQIVDYKDEAMDFIIYLEGGAACAWTQELPCDFRRISSSQIIVMVWWTARYA
jgi:hypothetical protein